MILIKFLYLNFILILSIILDLKYRKISNKYILVYFIIGVLLNLIETQYYNYEIVSILLFRISFSILAFFFCIILFTLKIIGGSDGKIMIIMIYTMPIKFLGYYDFFLFFLGLCLLFIAYLIIRIELVRLVRKEIFEIFLKLHLRSSITERFFILSSFLFLNWTKLPKLNFSKYKIKSKFIIFDFFSGKLKFTVQYRPPLTILLLITFYLVFVL